jgi:integrase
MPKVLLTAASVARLRPGFSRLEVADARSPGLYLIIQTSGHKSWAMRFRRPSGRQAKLTLGPVDLSGREPEGEPKIGDPLTLASARLVAASVQRERNRRRDVVAERRSARLEVAARSANTFDAAARDFVEQYAMRRIRRWRDQARLLGIDEELKIIPRGLADRWRDRPLAEITDDDVFAVVDEVRERGVPGLERRSDGPTEPLARLTLSCLSRTFNWLIERRRIGKNPCAGIARPRPPRPRDRVLSADEIKKFWRAADAERPEFGAVLKLLLLTGCRLNEVAGMRRSELDGETWTIPGERTKNRRAHVVWLAPLARQLLGDGTGSLAFTTDGRAPVASFGKIKRRLDKRMSISPWRLHDLRRTCATGMAELGVAPHVVEAVLNHVSGARAGVAGIYNKAAYSEERRAALARWAAHVEGLVSGRLARVLRIRS